MAFLVCYSRRPPEDHTRHQAIYLDQKFYELIFSCCRDERGPYEILREIASMRYKSPTLVVREDRLDLLQRELETLSTSGHSHHQISEFRRVCHNARAAECALAIGGDMYPELWRAVPDMYPEILRSVPEQRLQPSRVTSIAPRSFVARMWQIVTGNL